MSEQRPTLIILGGINGAGKSSAAAMMANQPAFAAAAFLDPDKATARVRAAQPQLSQTAAHFAGLRQIAEAVNRWLAARQSFVVETVLANAAYRRIAEAAQADGWSVWLIYVGVPTIEDSIARVALRVAKGGHAVPEPEIRRRWPRSHKNLAWFATRADVVDVIANPWNAPPRMVARARAGAVELLDDAVLPAVTEVLRALLCAHSAAAVMPEPRSLL